VLFGRGLPPLPDGEPLRLRSPTQVVMAGSLRFDPAGGGVSAAPPWRTGSYPDWSR
jgi:hypothetical protein